MAKWPNVIQEEMLPFALRHAVNFHNTSIHKGQSAYPCKLFTGEEPPSTLQDFCIFGCPTYILHKDLQDGSKIGKWKARSWQGVYIGHSSCHSGSIPLIYNPATTHVSPQYHVVYDEFFKTASGGQETQNSVYLDKLYNSTARWFYHDKKISENPYFFDTFWSGSGNDKNTPEKPNKKRKHQTQIQVTQSTQYVSHLNQQQALHNRIQHVSQDIPLRGSQDALSQIRQPAINKTTEGQNAPPTNMQQDCSIHLLPPQDLPQSMLSQYEEAIKSNMAQPSSPSNDAQDAHIECQNGMDLHHNITQLSATICKPTYMPKDIDDTHNDFK